jgi:hypothetical protein
MPSVAFVAFSEGRKTELLQQGPGIVRGFGGKMSGKAVLCLPSLLLQVENKRFYLRRKKKILPINSQAAKEHTKRVVYDHDNDND